MLSQSLTPPTTVAINTIKAQLQNVTSTRCPFRDPHGGEWWRHHFWVAPLRFAPAASTWNTFVFAAPVTVASGVTVYLTYVSNTTDVWFLTRDATATGQAYNGGNSWPMVGDMII